MTSRLETWETLLDYDAKEQHLPLYGFRHLCSQGIPDAPPILRARAWRVLLSLVDVEHNKRRWPEDLKRKRDSYRSLAEEVCGRLEGDRQDRLLTDIINDVVRTQSALSFFLERIEAPTFKRRRALLNRVDTLNSVQKQHRRLQTKSSISSLESTSTHKSSSSTTSDKGYESPPSTTASSPRELECLWEGLFRLLYVFAILNPTIGYVQGLNELAAPLLFVFGKDDPSQAEADTFWALSNIISAGMGDLLTPENDQSASLGLSVMFTALQRQFAIGDPQLSNHLLDVDLRPPFYTIRWFLTAFAQDFALPDLLRLWDALLAEVSAQLAEPALQDQIPAPLQLLLDVACSIVMSKRDPLLDASFPIGLQIIQKTPAELDVDGLVQSAILAKQQRQADAFMRDTADSQSHNRLSEAKKNAQKAIAAIPSPEQASKWWARRMSKAYESDASANLSKAAINLAVQSKRLQQGAVDFRQNAPAQFEQFKADVAARAAATRKQAIATIRPPSPEFDAPFKPPSSYSPLQFSPRSGYSTVSPMPPYVSTQEPGKVKPLLLSSSARRAGEEETGSGRSSRRSSWYGVSQAPAGSPFSYPGASPRVVHGPRRPSAVSQASYEPAVAQSPAYGLFPPAGPSPASSPDLPDRMTQGVVDVKLFSPRISQPRLKTPRKASGPTKSSSDADDEFTGRRSSSDHSRYETPFATPPTRSMELESVLPPDEPLHLAEPFQEPPRKAYQLVDAPASRLQTLPSLDTSERPPRSASLASSLPASTISPTRRSRLLASARKRLSGGFAKSPPTSPTRISPPPQVGDTGNELEYLSYYGGEL